MYKCAGLGAASAFYGTLLFLFIIPVCRAVLVNRTIDSNFGDPVTGFVPIYQPSQNVWLSQPCSGCYIEPDPTKAFDGTWNSATYKPGDDDVNVTLRFTGVAVWLFFILPNNGSHGFGLTKETYVNITLDGNLVQPYAHRPNPSRVDPTYNTSIYSQSGLDNIPHELVVGTNGYFNYSYINFDWAIYTVDDSAPTTTSLSTTAPSSMASTSSSTPDPQSSSSKTGVIVGSTLGGLAAIALVFVFLFRRLRRAPPVRYKNDEGTLDIDVPTHHQPNHIRQIPVPVPVHAPTQSKAVRERQREIDEQIRSAQRQLDNLGQARNTGSADPPTVGPSEPNPELTSLRNDMQQLRDQIEYLHAQRESDLALVLPPAYTNNVE